MELADILLWTFSLLLAVLGITFGFMAQRNSSRANKRIEEIISSSWAAEEAQRFFFDNIKSISMNNHSCIQFLKNSKDSTYHQYAMHSSLTRMVPISNKIMGMIQETEFKDLATTYFETKKALDKKFLDVIKDFAILSEDIKVPKEVKTKLIKYHEDVIEHSTSIIKSYNHIIRMTNEVALK